jgi:hypothetical protein
MKANRNSEPGLRPLSESMAGNFSVIKAEAREHINARVKSAFGNERADAFGLMADLSFFQCGNEDVLIGIAISRIHEQFGLREGQFEFDVAFVEPGELKPLCPSHYSGPEISPEFLGPEVQKRHLCNMLIQGNSHHSQLAFLEDNTALDAIDPEFSKKSKQLIAATDQMLLRMPAPPMGARLPPPSGINQVKVTEKVDGETVVTIYARAEHFPVLVHELAKGVTEALALWGLPEDLNLRKKIYAEADVPHYEFGDLKYAHVYWAKVRAALPPNIDPTTRSLLLVELFRLEAPHFNEIVESACNGDPEPLRKFWAEAVQKYR